MAIVNRIKFSLLNGLKFFTNRTVNSNNPVTSNLVSLAVQLLIKVLICTLSIVINVIQQVIPKLFGTQPKGNLDEVEK